MYRYSLVLIFFSSLLSFSQELISEVGDSKFSTKRKGQLFFKLGTEFRITPIPYENSLPSPSGFFTNVDQLHSGPAISYGLEIFIRENLSIGLDHNFRYETLLYDVNQLERGFVASKSQKELLHGFNLYFSRYFKISNKKPAELFIRAGISSFNGGSQFLFVSPVGEDENGEPITFLQNQADYVNFGLNSAVGYRNNRTSILTGLYFSNGGTFFQNNFQIITPYVKITYTLGRL